MTTRLIDWTGHDSQGNKVSGSSSVTVDGVTPPASTLAGVSNSPWDHGPLGMAAAVRVYKFSAVDKAVTPLTDVVCVTDPGVTSGSALDTQLRNLFARHPTLTVHWAHNNEVDRDNPTMSTYLQQVKDMRAVVDKYPGASMWIDLTANNIRQGVSAAFKVCAPYLHGVASSCYPPGRQKNPAEYSAPPTYIDPILALVKDWGISAFSCWEWGTPVSSKYDRPTVAAEAATYMRTECLRLGLDFEVGCWWDNQSDSNSPDNRLQNDNPASAQAWITALS